MTRASESRARRDYHYLRRIRHELRGIPRLNRYGCPERIERVHVEFFPKVKEILFHWDPLNMMTFALEVGFGLDDHEFAPEAASLVLLSDRWTSPEALAKLVCDVLEYWFAGKSQSDEFYKALARELWNAWMHFPGKPPEQFPDDVQLPPRPKPAVIRVDEGEGTH